MCTLLQLAEADHFFYPIRHIFEWRKKKLFNSFRNVKKKKKDVIDQDDHSNFSATRLITIILPSFTFFEMFNNFWNDAYSTGQNSTGLHFSSLVRNILVVYN